jgi:1-acyl-sn-glycerol-3-phosphate acyltransferase
MMLVVRDLGRRCFRIWRGFATALSFSLFGVFGLALSLVLLILSGVPGLRARRKTLSRRLISFCMWLFICWMRLAGLLTYRFDGPERLGRPGQLIIANHPSLIDVVFLLAFVPGACCVVKSEAWRNPFMAGVLLGVGYIPNKPTGYLLAGAQLELAAGESLIIFPEGTRTTPGQAPIFHRGTANLGVRFATVVTPVFISVSPTTLTKNESWYRIPVRRPHFELSIGEDLDMLEFSKDVLAPVAARRLQRHLLGVFKRHLG